MSTPSYSPPNRSSKSGAVGRKTNKLFFIVAIVSAIVAAGAVLFMFLNISETAKYYAISQDTPARTPINPELLTEIVAPIGSIPPNALSLEYISENELFAAYPLQAGEVISTSVVQEQTPILTDVPEGYVAVSMTIPADFAVAGKVARDDRVDVIATNSETMVTKIVLRGVRILDTAATLEAEDDSESDSESAAIRGGIPTIYTVALTPEDAVILSSVQGFPLTLALTDPETVNEEEVNVQINLADIFGDEGVGLSGGSIVPDAEGEESPTPPSSGDDTSTDPANDIDVGVDDWEVIDDGVEDVEVDFETS